MSGRQLRSQSIGPQESWQDVVARGFKLFQATEGSGSDGSQECTAAIMYHAGPDAPESTILGSTGHGGHAEMHALSQFVTNVCAGDVATFADYATGGISVWCESKPCCLHCSAILGLLGITPWSVNTKKSALKMGSTQWGMPMLLRAFVAKYTKIPENVLADIDSTKS